MKRHFIILAAIIFLCSLAHASDWSTTYRLEIPATASQNWTSIISKDIMSIDTVMTILSTDVSAMTTDHITTVSTGKVGRIRILSDDGNYAYILLYAPND